MNCAEMFKLILANNAQQHSLHELCRLRRGLGLGLGWYESKKGVRGQKINFKLNINPLIILKYGSTGTDDLPCTEKAFQTSGKVKIRSRSSSAIFQKVYFWPPMQRKSTWDIRERQNDVKVIKVIKCNLSKREFLTYHEQKRHFRYHGR